jgi:hypothetical protein
VSFRPGFYLRLALVADLWVYLLFIVSFVLLPLFPTERGAGLSDNPLTPIEIIFAFSALIPAYFLAGRLIVKPHFPGNESAYLVTALYGLIVLATFLTVGRQTVLVEPPQVWVTIVAFLGGVVGAGGAHVFDGGKNPLGPRVERWLKYRESGDA